MSLRDDRDHAARMERMRRTRERMTIAVYAMFFAVAVATALVVINPEAIGSFLGRIAAGFKQAAR